MQELRIVLGDSDEDARENLKRVLSTLGYRVIGEAGDGMSVLRIIENLQPDLVILEVQLPVMSGLEVAKIVEERKLAPVLLLSTYNTWTLLEKAKETTVFGYLVKPPTETALVPAIELSIANFQKVLRLEREIEKLRDTIEARKIVEKAKGILMETLGLSEREAFKKIQAQSMNKRATMKEIAQTIVLTYDLKKKR